MTEPQDSKGPSAPVLPPEPALSCPWPRNDPLDPDDRLWQRGVLDGSSGKNRNFLISFLLFQWYLILIILGVTDFDLFVPDSRINLPLLNLQIPLFSFFIVSPVLLLAFHFNLLFNLHEHGKLVADWCKRYEEPPKLSPFLFNYLFKLKKAERGFLLLPLVWSFLVYYIPLFTFVLVQWRFSDYHHQLMTSYHFAFVVLDFVLVLMYSRIWDLPFLQSLVGKRDQATKWEQVKAWFKQGGIDHFFASPWLGPGELFKKAKLLAQNFPFGVLLISLSAGVNYQAFQWVLDDLWVQKYAIHRNDKGEIDGVRCSQQTGKRWLVLDFFCSKDRPVKQEPSGFLPSREFLFSILVPVLDLHEQELVRKKPEDSLVSHYTNDLKKKGLDALLEFGQGYNLQGRGLQLANLTRANLLKVDFREANLQEAYLYMATLQGANLSQAKLQKAKLWLAQLQGALLIQAQLQGAGLSGAELQGADLSFAQLQGANLNTAQLQGADLSLAQLQGVYLIGAQLEGAQVTGANFYQAYFSPNQLQATYGHAVSPPPTDKLKSGFRKTSNPPPLGDKTAFLQARKGLLCSEEEFLTITKNILERHYVPNTDSLADLIWDEKREDSADQALVFRQMYQDPACRSRLLAIKEARLYSWDDWLQIELEKPEYDFSPQKAGGADR